MSLNGNVDILNGLNGKITAIPLIDKTLTKENCTAEAKAVGDALAKKVNVIDIVDNLATEDSNRPLSAKQGVEIKRRIDDIDPHFAENVIYGDTNVKDAIDEAVSTLGSVNDRFKVGSYSNTTQQFTLPVRKSALVIMSTSGNSDLFIVSNYDANNKNVARLSNNMSTFSVTISGDTVSVKNENYWYKYNAIII